MSNDVLAFLTIVESIEKIETYSHSSQNADDFYHDSKSFDACMIHFITIGEMIDRLSPATKELNKNIPWRDIKDFRNLVTHNYFGIDADELWDIIQNHLPVLKINIKHILQHNDA